LTPVHLFGGALFGFRLALTDKVLAAKSPLIFPIAIIKFQPASECLSTHYNPILTLIAVPVF